MRFLARPPQLDLNSSFAAALRADRFTQLDLITQGEVQSEAKKQGLSVNEDLLRRLDREGAFQPVAFADGHPSFRFGGSRWDPSRLTFRDEVGFRGWSRYAFRENGRRRVVALYSPWQLMYLKNAVEEREWSISVPLLLSRHRRLLTVLKGHRRFVQMHRDLIASLELHWRPTVLLLCWLQNRYLPLVRERTILVYEPEAHEPVNPLYRGTASLLILNSCNLLACPPNEPDRVRRGPG